MSICTKCNSEEFEDIDYFKFCKVSKCKQCNYNRVDYLNTCCKNPDLIIRQFHSNNSTTTLYYQCKNCSGSDRTKKLSQKKYSKDIDSEFDYDGFENWKLERENEKKKIYNLIIKESNYLNSNKYKYYKYLESNEWKAIRNDRMKMDNYLCQECRNAKADEVHHITYNRIFEEILEDLISVCKPCHKKLHGEPLEK